MPVEQFNFYLACCNIYVIYVGFKFSILNHKYVGVNQPPWEL